MVASVLALAAFASVAVAQSTLTRAPSSSQVARAVKRATSSSALPLTDYTYSYGEQPYQVNPYASGRGPQSGYNICNSTTSGANSQCQTLIANSASDFCLWGSPTTSPNGTIGDDEAAVVAYCTTDKWGARVLPAGSITGLQVMHTSAYIQWTGYINMSSLNLASDDTGGELDPHGADLAGNPLGGLVFSTGLPSGDNTTEIQAISWNNFVGSSVFCLKLCDPTITSPDYCENNTYNMPASYVDGEFTECDGDLQDPAGTYTGTDGSTTIWSQPESLAADTTLPWTPRIPASSNCITYESSALFANAVSTSSTSAAASSATAASASGSSSGSAASARSGTSSGAATTGSKTSSAAASATSSSTSGATSVAAGSGLLAAILGAVALLA